MRRPRRLVAVLAIGSAAAVLPAVVGAVPAWAANCPAVDPPAGPDGTPGDLNGDGHADAVVGEPGRGQSAGAFRVLYGHVDGLVADQTDSARGDRLISRSTAGVEGTADAGDEFGAAVAVADFNLDGCADIAVGAPGDADDAGSVSIFYGSPGNGLVLAGDQLFSQNSSGVPGVSEDGDRFGAVLAAGDFNGDEVPDLAIGGPGEDVGPASGAGAVWVLFGDDDGLGDGADPVRLTQAGGVPGTPEGGDRFGAALAAGDFDLGGGDDLAVGAPGENDHGSVTVFPGPGVVGSVKVFSQDTPGIPGGPQPGDRFGAALATGDVTGDGSAELAIGVPGERDDRGRVVVLYGSENELHGDDNAQSFSQDTTGVGGLAAVGDEFGAALAMGPFDDGHSADLAVGVPGDQIGTGGPRGGAVNVLFASDSGLAAAGDQRLHQDVPGISGAPESGDRFGESLSAAPVQFRTLDSLLIGVPSETIDGVQEAGLFVFVGSNKLGFNPNTSQPWSAASPGVQGGLVQAGRLGRAVG